MSDRLIRCTWPPLAERYAAALRQAVAFVFEETDPVGVIATGTIVRGTPHATSDLDVYVIHDAHFRRRVQRFFGDPALGAFLPVEIFINPPTAVRRYFIEEHADGRPLTAHMLATGFVVFEEGPIVTELREEASSWLAQPSYPDDAAIIRSRYAAASTYEDSTDVADEDPATSMMLLSYAVIAMLQLWCRQMLGTVPRGKDLLQRVAERDPALGELARRVFSDASVIERHAAAAEVADRTIAARGFFEWDSGPGPA